MDEEPAPKRVRLNDVDLEKLSKDELILKWKKQESYITALENKTDLGDHNAAKLSEMEDRLHQQQSEYARKDRKDRLLVMRLATKEQELQEMANQLTEMTKGQAPGSSQLRSALLDPALNLIFQRMRKELEDKTKALQQAQDDMAAWKFTADSQMGKRLMSRCRTLIQENQELGKQVSAGRTARLETELALQKKYSEELKGSQDELNDFVIELDEEVVGMQSTICALQQQLKDAKQQLANVKFSKTTEPLVAKPAPPATVTNAAAPATVPPVTNAKPLAAPTVTISAPAPAVTNADARTNEVRIKIEPGTAGDIKMEPRTYDGEVKWNEMEEGAPLSTEKPATRQSSAVANEPSSWAAPSFERPGAKSPSTPTEEETFRIPQAPRTLEMAPMSPAIPEEAAVASDPAPQPRQEEAAMKPRTTPASSSLQSSEQPMDQEVDTSWIKKEAGDADRTFQVPHAAEEQQVNLRTTDDRANPETTSADGDGLVRNKRKRTKDDEEEDMETTPAKRGQQSQSAGTDKETPMETAQTEPVPVGTPQEVQKQMDGIDGKKIKQEKLDEPVIQPEPTAPANKSDDHTETKDDGKQVSENQEAVSENQTTVSDENQAEASAAGLNQTTLPDSKTSKENSTPASPTAPAPRTTNGNAAGSEVKDDSTTNTGTDMGSSKLNHDNDVDDTKNGEFSPSRPITSPPHGNSSTENNNQAVATNSNCNQSPSSNNVEEDGSTSSSVTEDGTTAVTNSSSQAVQNSSSETAVEKTPSVLTDRTNSPVKQILVKTNDGDGGDDGGLSVGADGEQTAEGQTNIADIPPLRENGPETVSN